MARIWVSFEEIKRCVRIAEAMRQLGVDLTQYTEGPDGSLTGPCPLPGHPVGDPNHRNVRQFRIDRRDGVDLFKCFAADCNAGGTVIQFAMQMLGRNEAHVRYFFWDHFREKLRGKRPRRQSTAGKKEPREEAKVEATASTQGVLKAPASLAEDARDAKPLEPMDHALKLNPNVAYLKQRGVSAATIARFGVGYSSRGRMAGCVAMPIYLHSQAAGENPIVYLGRFAGEDFVAKNKPKYLWGSAGFPKGKILVGLREAIKGIGNKPLVVVEGMFDMFRCVDAGYQHTACIVGSDMTDDQARLLISLKRPIVLAFDADPSGQAGARKAAGKLIRHTAVRVVALPDGKDPADLSANELRRHLSFLPS